MRFSLWFYKANNPVEPREEKMDDSILAYEEKLWQLFDITKNEMPDLAEAYYGSVKDAVCKEGPLDIKAKRLMSLAVAVQAASKDCMISQTSKLWNLEQHQKRYLRLAQSQFVWGVLWVGAKLL